MVALAILLFFLVRKSADGEPSASQNEPGVQERERSEAFAALRTNTISPGPTNAPPAGSTLIEQLLTLQAGQVSASEVAAILGQLKQQPTGLRAELNALVASTNEVDRVLASFLTLEVFGPSPEFLLRAAGDPSPHVMAEAAGWLYQNGRYPEWNEFLERTFAVMTADQFEAVMPRLDSRPIRLEVPAAMSLLGIGRGLEDYTIEMLRRNSIAVTVAKGQLLAATTPEIRKENLLKLLDAANPPEYTEVLRQIIATSQDDRPLRWQAVWNLGQTAVDAQALSFVSEWIQQHSADVLHDKLQEAATIIAARMNSTISASEALEQRLNAVTASTTTPDHERFALFAHYVRDCIRTQRNGDPTLLSPFRTELASRPATDAPLRRLIADIDYVLWKSNR